MNVAIEHSAALQALIAAQINQNNGSISFADFMQLALYAPELGYYSSGRQKFGSGGDFVTAPEIGNLFAQCVAQQCYQIFSQLKVANILEVGAGSGQLACDLLLLLQKLGVEINTYQILELSAALRHQQQQKIRTLVPELYPKIVWLDRLPLQPIDGVIIANEVLDAMPVTKFRWYENVLQEFHVSNDKKLALVLQPPSPPLINAFANADLARYIEPENAPYDSEINLWLQPWIKSLQGCLASGVILLFDYGFPRREYYHPARTTGTLMCHYQHQSHPDPLHNVGSQDITAHVDFTAVAEAADANNLQLGGFTNLASFLLNCGIIEFIDHSIPKNHELQLLTSPAEMGELFKVIALCKNLDLDLLGFRQFDKMHTL